LIAQRSPIQLHEWMFLGNFAHDFLGNSRTMSEAGQMKLEHFTAAAHIVHQVERIPFAADKSHDFTSNSRHAV
jgi:hypothetical protein